MKTKVLIADDYPVFCSGLKKLLEAEDMEVAGEASDGEQALSMSLEFKPDIIILNIIMPKLNGVEAIKQIKDAVPTTNILVLSAYRYDSYLLAALRAGASGFLHKGVCTNELVAAIKMMRDGGHPVDQNIAFNILSRLVTNGSNTKGALDELHSRELEVLKLTAKGMTNKEIAQELDISERTVQTHFAKIFRKLNVGSRTEALLNAVKHGWLSLEEIR